MYIEPILISATIGYFLGSIPFGLLLTYAAGLGDIRKIGSQNIGATNVLRTGSKLLAISTLLLDCGKGTLATLLSIKLFGESEAIISGLLALLGHNFPVWLKFKGGKGVATSLGIIFGLSWPVGLWTCGIWLLIAMIFRYSSLAALIALFSAPFYSWWFASNKFELFFGILFIICFISHYKNIKRLLRGNENKIF